MNMNSDPTVCGAQGPQELLKQFQEIEKATEAASGEKAALEKLSVIEEHARQGDRVDKRLGTLLVDFSLITEDMLHHSVKTACELGIPFGRILVVSGWLTARQLQWAVQLQALLNSDLISKDESVRVSDILCQSNSSLEESLCIAGLNNALRSFCENGDRLGDLLVRAEIIDADELAEAIDKSQTTGLPLGRCLILSRRVSAPFLQTAVNAQRFLREKKIDMKSAVYAIKSAHARQPVEPAGADYQACLNMPVNGIRIGELLMLSNIATEQQIQYAVEIGLINNVPIGKVLLNLGIIDDLTLENALFLQTAVSHGVTDPQGAVAALVSVHFHRISLVEAMRETSRSSAKRSIVGFKEFLADAGLATIEETNQAIEIAGNSPLFVSKALVFTGVLDESSLKIASCCHFYARENLLTVTESLMLLKHARHYGCTIDESMKALGLALRSNKPAPGSCALQVYDQL